MNSAWRLIAALCLLVFPAVSIGGSFSVMPVRMFLGPKDRAIAITLENDGDTEVVLQTEVMRWTQDANGVDILDPSDDVVVAPPIIKLAPKAKQVVRLAVVTPRDPGRQMTYRLFVREVPEVQAAKEKTLQQPIALVLSLPVFLQPAQVKRDLACEAGKAASRQAADIVCRNSGNTYAQIREVELRRGDKLLSKFEGSTYILPGVRRTISLKSDAGDISAGSADVRVILDDPTPLNFTVTLP